MNEVDNILGRFAKPVLTRKRIWLAIGVALVTDALQFGLGPFGWVLVDQGLDVLAMVLISWAIGFHVLLLPTFVIEFIPGPDMLPTWVGCTAAVIMLRKRAQPAPPIEVNSEVTRVDATAIDKTNPQAPPPLPHVT